MSLRTFLTSILLLTSLFGLATAQEKAAHPADTGLVLEMAFVKSIPPTYQTVYWPDSPNPGNWSARFGRIAGWQLPPGTLRVGAVRVLPVLTGSLVTVQVNVLRGKQLESEEPVGTYRLRENESVVVEAAKNFGVEPFEIKVIRLSSTPTNLPAVENQLRSVEVVGLEQVISSLPFIKVTFRSLSQKSIEALSVEVMQGTKSLVSGLPQGRDGKPLMLPGENHEARIPLATQSRGVAGNYLPSVISNQRLVITGVFFSDDTSEGSPPRDLLLGIKFGRKVELRRLLPLFESALAMADAELSDGPAKLRQQVEALSYKLTDEEQAELSKTVTTKQSPIEGASRLIRQDLLEFLRRFPPVMDGKLFRTWLVRAREHYSNWLARLEPVPVS